MPISVIHLKKKHIDLVTFRVHRVGHSSATDIGWKLDLS